MASYRIGQVIICDRPVGDRQDGQIEVITFRRERIPIIFSDLQLSGQCKTQAIISPDHIDLCSQTSEKIRIGGGCQEHFHLEVDFELKIAIGSRLVA